MARIIIRRNNNTVNGAANDTQLSGGVFEQVGDTLTGELVNDDGITATDDNATSTRFAGDVKNFVDPDTGTSNTSTGTGTGTRKRRQRSDAGTRRGTRKRNETETTTDIKSLLLTVHYGLAGMLHAPKLKLTETEAETLSAAIIRVTDLYDVRIIPEKQMAWLNLMIVAGVIYIPRMKKDKKPEAEQKQNVVTMPMNPVSGDATKVM